MKLRKNGGKLEKIEVANEDSPILRDLEVLEADHFECVNEMDCRNIYLQGGLASCTKLAFILNQHPCLPNCPYHKLIKLYQNRECYDGG